MDDVTFYNNLKNIIVNSNSNDTTRLNILEEINKRLSKLEQQEQLHKWNKLCFLIEETAKKFEKENKEYVDIIIDTEDNIITITNNLYNNWTVI